LKPYINIRKCYVDPLICTAITCGYVFPDLARSLKFPVMTALVNAALSFKHKYFDVNGLAIVK
jgi:hypothetical protein